MDVSGKVKVATVPRLRRVVRDVRIVAYQRPAAKVVKESPLIIMEDREVDVPVIAAWSTEPGIDGPPAAEEPRRIESGHEIAHIRDRLRN
jgi:hypothetical protein